MISAVLGTGVAVFVSGARAASCAGFVAPLSARVAQADVIVVGHVASQSPLSAGIAPEAFLKGPARPEELSILRPAQAPECPLAALPGAGERVLLMLRATAGGYAWPDEPMAYTLAGGRATLLSDTLADDRTESSLVADIRTQTNLYAVPATTNDDGASIDWKKTVLPVAAALLVVFGIGLLLMRTWHRIDPS